MRIALPLLALFICQGCGYYHKTLSQEAGPPARITKAALYQVLPPSFEKIPKPEDYESEAQWREETRGLAGEFHQAVADEVSSLEITAKVAPATPGVTPPSGILVEPVVLGIRREWRMVAGGYDFLTVAITVTKLPDKVVLYKGEVEVSSKRYGPVGYRAARFPGRLGLATWNLAGPIASIIKKGKIIPPEL